MISDRGADLISSSLHYAARTARIAKGWFAETARFSRIAIRWATEQYFVDCRLFANGGLS